MAESPVRARVSAGILLFRRSGDEIEVLLGHPGGPYFASKDAGAWSIPKGEPAAAEALIDAARREFVEETGHVVGSSARTIELGSVRQRGGKTVHVWAVEGDLDPAVAHSGTFVMEWPPGSGMHIDVPELDRVAWFSPEAARAAMNPAQASFVDRLLEALGAGELHRRPTWAD